MTAEPSFAAEPSEGSDLSSAFGRPATSSLRGLLPPRPRRSTEQTSDDAEAAEPAEPAEDGPDDAADETGGAAPGPAEDAAAEAGTPVEEAAPEETPADLVPAPRARRRGTAPAASGTRTAGVANRRWGSVRVTSQEHVELLVLVALRRGPADGRELATRLRDDSAGGLAAPPTTIQRTLHHLARHGLVERVDTDRRRYRLTILGTRIARARVRAWQAMRRAVDAVVRAADTD
ncbi:PadR family transcriptional regulator [Actinomycetospora succinea]|uniref:PadR family transcriptional regulator n=1 Tax=Actinomycetospora succinea TaxID=663603 RepID=A0A4R6VDE7_9PSEU|nr:PadR family transcriptional regulator [Actinomycetospora succinea]TDQ60772.1 PadR family transcriptional regulator [Actinomycetospora succinea]